MNIKKLYVNNNNCILKYIEDDRKKNSNNDPLILLNKNINKKIFHTLPCIINSHYKNSIKIDNKYQFKEIFYAKKEILNGIDFSNMVVAGGSICSILYDSDDINDIDIFLYNLKNDNERNNKLLYIINFINKKTNKQNKLYLTKNALTIFCSPKIQIILKKYDSIKDIIHNFDLSLSRVAFDGNNIYFTKISFLSYQLNLNIVDLSRRGIHYEIRLAKYYNNKKLGILFPNLNIHTRIKKCYIKISILKFYIYENKNNIINTASDCDIISINKKLLQKKSFYYCEKISKINLYQSNILNKIRFLNDDNKNNKTNFENGIIILNDNKFKTKKIEINELKSFFNKIRDDILENHIVNLKLINFAFHKNDIINKYNIIKLSINKILDDNNNDNKNFNGMFEKQINFLYNHPLNFDKIIKIKWDTIIKNEIIKINPKEWYGDYYNNKNNFYKNSYEIIILTYIFGNYHKKKKIANKNILDIILNYLLEIEFS